MAGITDFARDAEKDAELAATLRRPVTEILEGPYLPTRTWNVVAKIAASLGIRTVAGLCTAQVEKEIVHRRGKRGANELAWAIAIWLKEIFTPGEELDDADSGDSPTLPGEAQRRPGSPPGAARPQTEGDIQSWADAAGVADLLALPAGTLTPRSYPDPSTVFGMPLTVHQLLAVDEHPLPPPRRHLDGVRVSMAISLLGRLDQIARNRIVLRELEARHPLVEPAAAGPCFSELAAALDRARSSFDNLPARVFGAFVPAPLEFTIDPPRLMYDEADSAEAPVVLGYSHPRQVTIRLDRLARGKIEAGCSCIDARRGCPHVAAALDAALDMLRRPSMPAHGVLREYLQTPPWQRVLGRVEKDLAALPSRVVAQPERLIWVLRPAAGHRPLTLEAMVQRRGARGGWSKGSRFYLTDVRRRQQLVAAPSDARVLEIMTGDATPSQLFRAIEALAGAPNVYVGERRDAPLAIRRVAVSVALAEEAAQAPGADASSSGFTMGFRLGDTPIGAAALLAVSSATHQVIDLDAAANECRLALLPPEVVVLAHGIAREPAFTVPAAEANNLLARLERVQAAAPFIIPESLAGRPVAPDLRLLCRLTPLGENGLSVEVSCRPLPEAGTQAPGDGAQLLFGVRDGVRVSVRRDLAAERQRAHGLVESLDLPEAARTAPWHFQLDELEKALDVVAALRDHASGTEGDVVVEWPEESWRLKAASPRDLRLNVVERRDWFGVEGGIEVDGELLSVAALLEAVRARRRWVALGAGRFARIEDELRRRLETAQDLLLPVRGGVDLGAGAPEALASLVDDPAHLDEVPSFHELCARRARARQHKPKTPRHLRSVLRPYQVEGFHWLSRLAAAGTGACLADDMGLGKTLQILTVLLERASHGPALVIAPTSVVPNWISEAERFAPGLRRVLYRGPDRASLLDGLGPGDLVVTSYALALRDIEPLRAVHFAALVLDEAQALKNAQTYRARAIRTLDAGWRVALTGTPIENHLGELWSLYRIVCPALFGSWQLFRERFAYPIEHQRDPERRAALASLLRPFLLRRTKKEVTPELPRKTELDKLIDLSPAERRLYDAARLEAVRSLTGEQRAPGATRGGADDGRRRFQILAALTRLRQLACHPGLVDESSREPSSKLRALVELLTTLKETGHRALIFSQFVRFLELARAALGQAGIKLLMLDGSTPGEQRASLIQQFQAGAADAFLISLKAGGTGLNLTEADYVVHLDPWWNPAVEDQATDRTHRIGQKKPVTVVRLVARGTVEEAVLALHADKRALASAVLEGADGAVRLDTDELMSLFAAGADTALAEEAAEDAADESADAAPGALTAGDGDDSSYDGADGGDGAPSSLPTLGELDALIDRALAPLDGAPCARPYRRLLGHFRAFVEAGRARAASNLEDAAQLFQSALENGSWPSAASNRKAVRSPLRHLVRAATQPRRLQS